jgi:rRNA small subunit pseudouridine methyltransferase Nep1
LTKTIFLFADSALELVPKEIQKHEIIKKSASRFNKKPSEILLDSSYHYIPMKKIQNSKKRGRPDIIYLCLMNLVESTFVLKNPDLVEIYVHTIKNEIIKIETNVKLPRNYERFKGLMVQLFEKRIIEFKGTSLLKILEDENLQSLLKNIKPENRFLFSSKGVSIDLIKKFKEKSYENLAFIIGAFPYGKISQQINSLTNNVISIYPDSLNAWIVLNKILNLREFTINI